MRRSSDAVRTGGTAARQRELSCGGLHDLVMCRAAGRGSVVFLDGWADGLPLGARDR